MTFPLSPAQRVLWTSGDSSLPGRLHLPVIVDLHGSPDITALEAALVAVVRRHDALRIVFRADGEDVSQTILPADAAAPIIETATTTRDLLPALLSDSVRRDFDLASAPPLRCCLFSLEPARHVLALVLHRLVADPWSVVPLLRDLSRAYAAHLKQAQPEWAERPPDYRDCVEADCQPPDDTNPTLARQLRFWTSALADLPPRVHLPGYRGPVSRPCDCTERVRIRINPGLHQRVRQRAKEYGATTFTVLHGALLALLSAHGVGPDTLVATHTAGRRRREDGMPIGPFHNTLPFRARANPDQSYRALLGMLRRTYFDVMASQDVRWEHVCGHILSERVPSEHPAVDIALVLRPDDRATFTLAGLTAGFKPVPVPTHGFELVFDLIEYRGRYGRAEGIEGNLRFDPAAFDRESVSEISASYLSVVEHAVDDPHRRLSDLMSASGGLSMPQPPEQGATAVQGRRATSDRAPYVRPATTLEHQLVTLWERLLGIGRIGVADEFQALGGNAHLLSALEDELQRLWAVPLSLRDRDCGLTVTRLASELLDHKPAAKLRCLTTTSSRQPPLFLLHGDFSGGGFYAYDLARALGDEQPFYVLEPHGMDGGTIPDSIEEMADDYLPLLRTVQASGRYRLAGYCNGALVAVEIARRLADTGDDAASVVLIDPPLHVEGTRVPPTSSMLPPLDLMDAPRLHGVWMFNVYGGPIARYRPHWPHGRVTVLWPVEHRCGHTDPRTQWQRAIGTVDFRMIPGTHVSCVGQFTPELAAELRRTFDHERESG